MDNDLLSIIMDCLFFGWIIYLLVCTSKLQRRLEYHEDNIEALRNYTLDQYNEDN